MRIALAALVVVEVWMVSGMTSQLARNQIRKFYAEKRSMSKVLYTEGAFAVTHISSPLVWYVKNGSSVSMAAVT